MNKRRILSLLIVLALLVSVIPCGRASAAYLYFYQKKVEQGRTVKVYLYSYFGKKKPKWSLSNKKAKIVSKGKKWCKIKAKKAGSVYLKCKIGKKTYKKRISIGAKSKVTYANYNSLYQGMTLSQVINKLGMYEEVDSSITHTEQEYREILELQREEGGWEDYLYREKIEYKWQNPYDGHRVYATFYDGILREKNYY